jgi:hypothetical protein
VQVKWTYYNEGEGILMNNDQHPKNEKCEVKKMAMSEKVLKERSRNNQDLENALDELCAVADKMDKEDPDYFSEENINQILKQIRAGAEEK